MITGDVFLVDDNLMNIRLLAEILKGAGYQVRAATSGKRAVETIRTHPPELVLLDVNMPEMDGYQVCETLKADPKTRDIPIIFISAHDAPVEKVRAFRAGAVDYVTKPFEAEEVVARVATHLEMSRLQRETASRKAELEGALQELRQAQEKIARLTSSSAGMLEDPAGWARGLSGEVAQAVGARSVSVFAVEDGQLTPLAAEGIAAPLLSELWKGERPRELTLEEGQGTRLVVPVLGMTGELRAVLIVDGKADPWNDGHRQVVRSFAYHLGTVLDLHKLREQLAASETRRATTRREMKERGIELMELCPKCGRCFGLRQIQDELRDGCCPDDRTPLDASVLLPYRIADRYRLVRLLGQGGMGMVFEAADERLHRDVALKVIRGELLNDVAMRLRLEREAQTVARISHPGVVALYDTGELEDGSYFLVMELLAGYDLERLLARHGRGKPAQVASLIRQAGSALQAAHRAGIVHRDVKPANLFLTPLPKAGFAVKVVDFGVARPISTVGRLTVTGVAVGTPSYMSPEQARGEEVDGRADVYALAAAGYEALSGRPVVARDGNFGEIFMEIVSGVPPPLSKFVGGLTPELDLAFQAGLAKRASDRPPDVEAWSAAVARFLSSLPPHPDDAAGWPEGNPPVKARSR